ncbi:hypothetical protein KC334_g14958 [Hortaea werneckii]|uniref:Rhodopsin domain-containing protein n=1 Tax=Hortaea werneckii TaxID=91943 RepID=A0A3M6ZW12_HORWE|nr:hypothetical protein KC334_g14958 [Hortaea werneckii]RMY19347.1 hypothetical protein D0866_12866 [Hortaea werneckii]
MVVRLIGRWSAVRHLTTGDYLTLAALACLFVRLGMIHTVLEYGSSNITTAYRESHSFTTQEIERRTIGSKLTIANRFFYNTYLWLQKLVLLDLYRRFYLCLPCERQIYLGYLVIFAITYVGVQLSNITECQPVSLYWQIVPDPGPCSQAHVQLLVLGIVNIVTDVMLMALPWPMLIKAKLQPRRKFELAVLFLFGIFIIVITAVRLPLNNNKITSQVSRSTWASVELMVAAIVVNAPTLYGLWNRRRGRKDGTPTDPSLGPPRVPIRTLYFGPSSTVQRARPRTNQSGSGDPLVGIQQTVSVHIQEEKTLTEQQTSSGPAEELHELHRTGSPSGNKEVLGRSAVK